MNKDINAIGIVRQMVADGQVSQEVAEKYFPELKESNDDERIKQFLIHEVTETSDEIMSYRNMSKKDVLTWFEKQVKKDEEILILKDRIESLHAAIKALKEVHKIELKKQNEQKPNPCDGCINRKGCINCENGELREVEQKPVNKVKPKFKVGDSIKTTNEEPLTITKIDDKGYWSKDLFICSFDEECIWDLVEQNPAWSEDDKRILDALITSLINERFAGRLEFLKGIKVSLVIDWLKSLKEKIKKETA